MPWKRGVAWSVGPSSNGVEFLAGTNVTSRFDIGSVIATRNLRRRIEVDVQRVRAVRGLFAVKEQDVAPVTLGFSGQIFVDDYPVEGDSGKYVQLGTTIYKKFELTSRYACSRSSALVSSPNRTRSVVRRPSALNI